METMTVPSASSTYILQIPEKDRSFFNSLVKKMGWTVKRNKTNRTTPAETISAI